MIARWRSSRSRDGFRKEADIDIFVWLGAAMTDGLFRELSTAKVLHDLSVAREAFVKVLAERPPTRDVNSASYRDPVAVLLPISPDLTCSQWKSCLWMLLFEVLYCVESREGECYRCTNLYTGFEVPAFRALVACNVPKSYVGEEDSGT